MIIRRDGYRLIIEFQYNPKLLAALKKHLPYATFNWAKKHWWVNKEHEDHLRWFAGQYGFTFLDDNTEPEQQYHIAELPELDQEIELKMALFPYQKQGVAYALEKKRVIVGDKMGLGKTAQAIATVHAAEAFPCLVICPASLKINWQREWEKWTDRKVRVMDATINRKLPAWVQTGMIEVFVVNYESLKKYFVDEIKRDEKGKFTLRNVKFSKNIDLFKSIVIDESHRCKDYRAQQSKFVKGISAGKEWVLALTGTPVVNKPRDLVSQLAIINRLGEMGGYKYFMSRYCGGYDGQSNLSELNYRLSEECFFSRNKEDVLKDLPDKMRQVVMCEIDKAHRQEYQHAIESLEEYLKQYRDATEEQVERSMRGQVMVQIGICKDIAARGKLEGVRDFIQETMDEDEKLVVFLHQHSVHDQLASWFPHAVSVTGRDKMDQRQANIDNFMNNPNCKLIFCSIKAAGVGITLTASSKVAFVELGWHPAEMDQAEDRCHRIGQDSSVQCIYFLGRDTIDEYVFQVISKKREMVNEITGGNSDAVQETVLDSMIEILSKGKEVPA